ncbi:hypothetical protein BO94DRAFT_563780 [Aspergillus sclerotioniger CBS 115572]|uniref:Zn(2)-C6 fungal-type domain-containing protein n=1 Tax=Aspergillus sclerotioniger CBS 115572 TaxID=1450535 RepID=A0A317X809_9EURO|nr:hypothetical protein BO94DRAFT_563780 [Aspergillus sclerotioniger CBS 115572]PWY94341.1 hypothetical protein BO94DRAFT_563780 [Aspergillus sclerotioniger CBS 115572]
MACHRCNRKKIRCSKTVPCNHCVRLGLDCVFPGPGRAPRRKKRPLKAELVARLKSLEQELTELTGGSDRAEARRAGPGAADDGTLIVDGDSTQYLNHEALIGLGGQIKELQDIVASSGETTEAPDKGCAEPEQGNDTNYFVFGYSSLAYSLREYHPNTTHSLWLWQTYEQNVAPVVAIFHKLSLHRMITKASTNSEYLDRSSEAVVFAVYFAAATSLRPDDCLRYLGEEHSVVLQRYRFATQQALSRAGFLQSRCLPVLQATVLFLTCLRGAGDADFVWTMVAAVHRLAQGLGIHRDGTHFGLTPFETEMRRRLWWSIYLLDTQSSESYPTGNLITEGSYDTRLPLNINDSDIAPESIALPEEHVGFSEMTFCLIRCEMTVFVRRTTNTGSSVHEDLDLESRLYELEKIHARLQERYLRFCDVSIPIQWTTATVIRLALARLWLVTHLPQWQLNDLASVSPNQEQLFLTAVEVVEFAYLLETDPRTSKWSWLFESYMQWHAVTFILAEMCAQAPSPETDRARDYQRGGVMMKPISRLMEQAAAVHGRTATNVDSTLRLIADPEASKFTAPLIDGHETENATLSRSGEDMAPMEFLNEVMLGENT